MSTQINAHLSERGSTDEVENGALLMPKFGSDGLLTAVAVDATSNKVLMVAHMNKDALLKTIETKEAWYYSRSRSALWRKGETSGQIQKIREIQVDCDQDALVLMVDVEGDGGCCHTGRPACFYRRIDGVDAHQRITLAKI
jgi:phosphoribosyl-AMP cyclohydrolase